jgi:hypothetical protein
MFERVSPFEISSTSFYALNIYIHFALHGTYRCKTSCQRQENSSLRVMLDPPEAFGAMGKDCCFSPAQRVT